MRRILESAVPYLLAAGLPFAAGCGGGNPGSEAPPAPAQAVEWAYEKAFGSGPVSLVLRLDRIECGLADRVLLEEELRIEEGFEADFPEYLPEDFEGFQVADILYPENPPPAGGIERRRKRLVLEPEHSGELRIAPLAVFYRKKGEDKEDFFLTDEVPVTVHGLEGAGGLEELEISEPRGLLEEARQEEPSRTLVWALAGGAAALVFGISAWYLARRLRKPPPPVPPHEIAWEALRRLLAQGFHERGEYEPFFVHLSAILRRYIEDRFGVHAPERTTEEFLDEAQRAAALAPYKETLAEFLRLSDQVKFACYNPDPETVERSFETVKRFITETTPEAEDVA